MPNRHKKPAIPPLTSNGTSKNSAKFSPQKYEEELQTALESGDADHVMELLDSAPSWMKKQPEFMLFRASALLTLGHEQESMQLLLEIERKNPRLTEVHAPLALLYMDRDWPAHALQAAKRALSDRHLLDETRESIEEIIQEATDHLQRFALKFGVSVEIAQQASIFHEKALIAMDESKFIEVDYFAQKAIKLIPAWNSPHNNRAQALYFTGKSSEAIEVLESVLAHEAENVFALRSLVTFHYGLDQIDQARVYAGKLEALAPQFSIDGLEIEHLITVLALVEDTPALWKIAKKYLDQPADILIGRSWYCLAVAAARSGKWKNALDLIQKANDEGELPPAGNNFNDQLRLAKSRRPIRLDWMPPEYPGVDLFLNTKVYSELETLLDDFSNPLTPSQRRKLDGYLQKYTFVKTAMKRLLWGENGYQLALEFLPHLDQADADAEILRFALSQVGTQEARMQAIMQLMQTGRYTGSKIIKLWNEELGEWREVALNTQRIGEIPLIAQPKTMVLIEKAHKVKKPEEAVSLLRKAVVNEPTCAMAIFNLGVMLVQSGHTEEGEALIQKSVIVDPGYTYGHASIALTEVENGNEQAALDHLEYVSRAELIATDTAVMANLAWSVLALRKRDLKTSRKHFDLAAKLNPEHRLLKNYEPELTAAENFGFLLEFQRESAVRAHQKLLKSALTPEMTLRDCLETHTRDMMNGTAKFLHITSSGKKGELADWLVKNLLGTQFLQTTLAEVLEEKEREALRWVLEAGGVRPWKEFTHKYGDDMFESTFWIFHVPESIPGRLRMSGLFYSGTLEGQQVAFIPPDVRSLLIKLLT